VVDGKEGLAQRIVMPFFQRRVPSRDEVGRPVFVTWTLAAGPRQNPRWPVDEVVSGEEFQSADRLLDEARRGPTPLRDHEMAAMVERTLHAYARAKAQLELLAYVVMPNHLHMLLIPLVPLSELTVELRDRMAKRANELLDLQGAPLWCPRRYEHLVNGPLELEQVRKYIEQNPVRAGLACTPQDYRYSSARERLLVHPFQAAAAS